MRDLDEERDAYFPFQRAAAPRGARMPYVIAALTLALLAVFGMSIVTIDDARLAGPDRQVTTENRPAGGSATFN